MSDSLGMIACNGGLREPSLLKYVKSKSDECVAVNVCKLFN